MLLVVHVFGVMFIEVKKHIDESIWKGIEVIVDEICT
jgi:hypothetical protein